MESKSTESSAAKAASPPAVVQPAADIYEGAADYLVIVDLPGVAEKSVNLTLDKSELTLEAPASWSGTSVTYRRSFSVPTIVDAEHLDASLSAGVLKLRLPKRPDAKPRKIQIATA